MKIVAAAAIGIEMTIIGAIMSAWIAARCGTLIKVINRTRIIHMQLKESVRPMEFGKELIGND